MAHEYILLLSCPDRKGIVHAVSGFLVAHDSNIIDSAQFGDSDAATFFMRIQFSSVESLIQLQQGFESVAGKFLMQWPIYAKESRSKVILLVSKMGHCLNDLLFRINSGLLSADIAAVISNHSDHRALVERYGIPYFCFPLASGSSFQEKAAQEQKIREVIDQHQADMVILARYMQIFSPQLCHYLHGRAINIHHSFLPSFKGARPYTQAYQRGVKLIGATAHVVTTDLDEGPIIEQDVARVDHSCPPEQLAAIGQDVESLVLSRAVQWFTQHRIILNGTKTVVFR